MKKIFKKIIPLIEIYLPDFFILLWISLWLASILTKNTKPITSITSIPQFALFILFSFILSLSIIIIINKFHNKNTLKYLGFHKIIRKEILLGILFGIIIFIVLGLFEYYIGSIIKIDDDVNISNLGIMLHGTKNIYIFSFLIGFLASIKEEILRVFVFEKVKENFSKTFLLIFIFLYSFYFGLGHTIWGLSGIIGAFLFSLILMFIYLWRRNIYILIIIHLIWDFFGLLFLVYLSKV